MQAMGASAAGRALVYCDAGLVAADPTLPGRICAWFAEQTAAPRLAALPEVLPGGEAAKQDLGIIERVARQVVEQHIDRHSWIIMLGGGAFLDAIGCAAALAHRGIRQIRLPSTTLAQADAGLG
ncbi:MAG: 3-dehydroquinate synthase, partial [Desulfohalobiaceae bacterium]